MEGNSQNQQSLPDMLGLAACLLAKNLALWYLGRKSRLQAVAARFTEGGTKVAKIERIIIYPVKSCSGVELQCADIAPGGLVAPSGVRDRSYVVLDELNENRFVSLKVFSRLSAVKPLLDPECPGAIKLSADGHPTVKVTPTSRPILIGFRSERLTGMDCGDEIAEWLNRVCESRGFRMAFCASGDRSKTMPKRMRDIGDEVGADSAPVNPIAYADASPILLLSDVSMQHLNKLLSQQTSSQNQHPSVDWRSFRPNLVVAGVSQPHAEDNWGRIRICGSMQGPEGLAQLSVAFPCERCIMVNLAYSTDGLATKQEGNPVLGALAPYRSRRPQFRNPLFGANCAVLASGPVAIGDQVFAEKEN